MKKTRKRCGSLPIFLAVVKFVDLYETGLEIFQSFTLLTCWFVRLRVRRSNFMRSKLFFSWDRIHEIKFFGSFHEIKIPYNYSISWSRHFSWDRNSKIALLGNFDLMIDLLVTSTIMRSKFKKALLAILISWSIC
jgi:hypothetical protein